MNILTNSHFFSNLVLSITGVFVFLKYFKAQTLQSRLLWGIFLLSISINAFVELLIIAGTKNLENVHNITQVCELTLGPVCLVVASFSLILKYTPSVMVMISTFVFGLTIFLSILQYKVPFVGLIIQPFCIVVTLCIACLGLAYRRKSALWVVFAMTLLALSTKSQSIPVPMHPLDLNRYIIVLALICTGRAAQEQHKILF